MDDFTKRKIEALQEQASDLNDVARIFDELVRSVESIDEESATDLLALDLLEAISIRTHESVGGLLRMMLIAQRPLREHKRRVEEASQKAMEVLWDNYKKT